MQYHITGGKTLSGELTVSGSKNAALPILSACLLCRGTSVIHNCPAISDVFNTIKILEHIGCKCKFEAGALTVDSRKAENCEIPAELASEMRSSIIFLGALTARFKKAKMSLPGGCNIGERPIDYHLNALSKLGVFIGEDNGQLNCSAEFLEGCRINLDFPSVGATENAMLAAVLAKGDTIINNAAKEPEIVDLQNFINKMGGRILGAGSDTIVIHGVEKLAPAEHTVIPDRIVAGTYLIAAAITGGEIWLNNVMCRHLESLISKLTEAGCLISEDMRKGRIYLDAPPRLRSVNRIMTLPYPGFPTDLQPQISVMLAVSEGVSIVEETIFEGRMGHVPELRKMRANIALSSKGMTSIIQGAKKLKAATLISKDLRCGSALILAGLAAEGVTIVKDNNFISRGYQNIAGDLNQLGAQIEVKDDNI